METGQEDRAGEVRESEGDFQGAINLYLKAGLPAKAARLAMSQSEITNSSETVDRIAASLIKGEFYERVSGSFLPPVFPASLSPSLLASASMPEQVFFVIFSFELCLLHLPVFLCVLFLFFFCLKAHFFSSSHLCLCNRWERGLEKETGSSKQIL